MPIDKYKKTPYFCSVKQDTCMVRIIVFDDVLLYCHGMKIALEQFPDIHVAGEAFCEEGIFELLAHTPVDVIVLGVNMPDRTGCVDVAKRIRCDYPATKIITVVDEDNAEVKHSITVMGIDGYLAKRNAGGHELAVMVRDVTSKQGSVNNIIPNL